MKTISTLTAAFLIIASFHVSANENKGKIRITTPSPVVTTPEDVNTKEIEELKNTAIFRLPDFTALNQEDVNANEIEGLKNNLTFRLPNIPALNHEDLDIKEIEQLKVQAPEMAWGLPSDVDTAELESLIATDTQETKF